MHQPKKINLVIINKYHGKGTWTFEDMMRCMLDYLIRSGFDAKISVNFIDPYAINILFGVGSAFSHSYSEINHLSNPSSTIIFNGEQIDSASSLITEDYLRFMTQYVIFDWCQANIDAIKSRSHSTRKRIEFPLFPAPILAEANINTAIKYDFGFYGALVPRRQEIIDKIKDKGMTVKIISGYYGETLSNQLMDCRYILNLHAYETDLLEINRCLRPMSMGIPVISETSTLPLSGNWNNSGIIFIETEGFADAAQKIITNTDNYFRASRGVIRFTNDTDNLLYVKNAMQHGIAALTE